METRLGLDQFHNLIDKGSRNTMIWAPRQSGKTYALVIRFLMTRNSVLFAMNGGQADYLKRMCFDLGAPDRRRDIHRIQQASYATHARMIDGIFVDEIDFIPTPVMEEALANCYPCLNPDGRFIAMSTPARPRSDRFYQRLFQDEFTVNSEGITDWRMDNPPLPTIFINVNDHFGKNEQEYFRI